jgi:hypothetical protein
VARQLAPVTALQALEGDVHDARAHQATDLVAEVLTHAPDLTVHALDQHDAEHEGADPLHPALLGDGAQDRHAAPHPLHELSAHGAIDGDLVLLLVRVARAEDLVDDVPVAGQEDEPLGRHIEPPDGEDAPRVADRVHDVVGHAGVRHALDTHRLVVGQVHRALFVGGLHHAAIDPHLVARAHARADLRHLSVHPHAALLDHPIGLAPRAHPALADELVEARAALVGVVLPLVVAVAAHAAGTLTEPRALVNARDEPRRGSRLSRPS